VNQKLDHLIPNKLDSVGSLYAFLFINLIFLHSSQSHVKDFLGLKNLIYEKLRLLAVEWKQLRSDYKTLQQNSSASETDKQTIRTLQSELDAKVQSLTDAKKKLREMKAQFSHVMDSNSAVKKNLYKREAMISEALKRLTLLSESPAKASIQDLLLGDHHYP
jgi:septation ring formation regulator EzrA